MMKCILFTLSLFLFIYSSSAGWVDNIYTSTLTGGQIAGGKSFGIGNAYCLFIRSDVNPGLECEVQHNITSATSIVISNGKRGETGPVVFHFNDFSGNYASGKWEFVTNEFASMDDLISEYLLGNFYMLITTEGSDSENTRGQIEQSSRFVSRLNSANTIPLASGTTSTGIATATYSPTLPLRKMSLTVIHNVARPTSLELHDGAENQIGDELYSFNQFSQVAYNNVQLSVTEQEEIFLDLLYLNIASTPNPTGDIRGQLESIDYIPEGAFTAFLTGEQVLPSPVNTQHTGAAIVTYNCKTKVLEYLLMHSIDDSTGAVIGIGSRGQIGTILDGTPTSKSPIFGSLRLTNEQTQALYTEQLFFQVYVGNFVVIRGVIGTEFDFFAYLSGSNELPSLSTPGKGCALAKIVETENNDVSLEFVIFHNINNAISLEIHRGTEGVSGPSELIIDSIDSVVDGKPVNSPIFGNMNLDDDDITAITEGFMYFQFPSTTHLSGEIRGQIRRINPCSDDIISYSVQQESSYNAFSYFTYGVDGVGGYNIIYDSKASLFTFSFGLLISLLFFLI